MRDEEPLDGEGEVLAAAYVRVVNLVKGAAVAVHGKVLARGAVVEDTAAVVAAGVLLLW